MFTVSIQLLVNRKYQFPGSTEDNKKVRDLIKFPRKSQNRDNQVVVRGLLITSL